MTFNQGPTKVDMVANQLDRVAGQVAALIAYMSKTAPALPDDMVREVQSLAQSMCRERVGSPSSPAPGLLASQTVEQIQKAAKARG